MKGKRGPNGFGGKLVDEATKQGLKPEGESVREAEQQELLKREEVPVPSVQGDKYLTRFVKCIFDTRNEERIVEMEYSVALCDQHKDLVDVNILNAWKYLERNHAKGVVDIEIPNQTVDLYLAPDDSSELHLSAAQVRHVKLTTVEKKGDGKAEEIMRLSFRIVSEAMKNATAFAIANYSNQIWIRMQAAQGELRATA
jgi:hypothetical protein